MKGVSQIPRREGGGVVKMLTVEAVECIIIVTSYYIYHDSHNSQHGACVQNVMQFVLPET
jgi:hypothetical protein